MLPLPIQNLIDILKTLPSIGPRQATRLAFHIARGESRPASEFSAAFTALQNLRRCPECFFVHEQGSVCGICSDESRRKDLVAIVEKETDLLSLERAKKFLGTYLVLGEIGMGGTLMPEKKARLAKLKDRLTKLPGGVAEEILLAMSPTTYGDFAAATVAEELRDSAKKITRLGRGIPTGADIEFADEETLGQAIQNRN